jgi:hypothetical protein
MDGKVDPNFFFQLALSLNFLLNAAALLMGIYAARKRQPTTTEELYRDFARKEDLEQIRTEHSKTAAEWFGALRQFNSSTEEKFAALIRSVALMEGELRASRGRPISSNN